MAWYIVLNPVSDAREGTIEINPKYANVKKGRWVFHRREATYWFRKDKAETIAVSATMQKPEYVGRIEVMWFKLLGYG